MDWWQIVIILLGIGLISVIIGMFAGIPLSKIILHRRERVAMSKNRVSSEFKSQFTTIEQLDDILKKGGLITPKVEDRGSEKTAERGNDKAVTNGQVEPLANDQIILELEKNHELSIEPRLDRLELFQTDAWDASPDIPNVLTTDLRWELTEAYLEMYAANNIIWFLKEYGKKSPLLEDQYMKMCNQIANTLSKVIPILKIAIK